MLASYCLYNALGRQVNGTVTVTVCLNFSMCVSAVNAVSYLNPAPRNVIATTQNTLAVT